MDPAHGPPLQARVAAANGTVLQLANMLVPQQTSLDDPGAHGMNRGKQKHNERGQELMRAVGMAGKEWTRQANTACRTRPLQANTAGGLSARHRPHNKRPQLAGLAAKTTAATQLACLSPCSAGGGSTVVLAAMKAGADLPNLSLPHLSPLPVTVPTHSLNL